MSGLPASWAFAALREVTTISPKFNAEGTTDEQLVHFVPMAAASEDFCGIDASRTRPLCEVRKGYTFFAEGDVLFAKITPCMENGKGGLVPCLSHRFAFGSTEFHVLRPSEAIASQWLAHFLSQEEFRKVARHNMTGTAGQLRVPTKWLETVQFPVAPLPEQTRIVEKLEELLGSLDAAVAELKAAQRKLAHYRQSLLKAAVEGALTAEWRAANGKPREAGAELLQRILQERRARWEDKQRAKFAQAGKTLPNGWQAKYREPEAPGTTDFPALPERWTWASVAQLAELVSGHTPKDAGQFADANGEVHWFKVGDMNADGNEDSLIAASVRFSAMAANELGLKVVPAGTIVFPKRGGAIATNKKRRLGVAAAYDLNMMGLIPAPTAADWLWSWFKGIDLAELSDGSNIPQINNPDIAPLCVPLPPLEEQAQIITALDAQLSAVKDQETALTRALRQAAAQRRNLLKAAFAGQLVPQDPADEPASELLARIRASKADNAGRTRAARNAK